MEEKKAIKISLSTLFLIVAIVIILIMGYFLYELNNKNTNMASTEKNLNAKIAELEDKVARQKQESEEDSKNLEINTENETSKMSFSEIMNMLYTKDETEIEGNDYDTNPSDSVYMTHENASGNVINVEYADVSVYNNEISFTMHTVEPEKNIVEAIDGITEEIVSVKILKAEGGAIPSVIYFLTRNGNVYYINENMINSNNFVAKQLTNLKEIVSIEIAETVYSGAMHASSTLIATTYSGEKIDILK